MLLMQQQELSGEVLPEPNTFIGGVGASTVTSASTLASKLGLTEGDIQNFSIDGNNNISCFIQTNYDVQSSAFSSNTEVTYFVDIDGYCNGLNSFSFKSTPNLKIVHGQNIALVNPGSNLRSSGILQFNTNVATLYNFNLFLADATYLKYVRLKNITNLTSIGGMRNMTSVERVYIPNTTAFSGTDWDAIQELFYNINSSATLYVNSSYDGVTLPHALDYAQDLGCTLVYVDDTTPPSNVTNLTASNITTISCDLNFTPPSSTNALDFYEVWVENIDLDEWHKDRVIGRYSINQEISGSGATITGLTSGTNYRIWIITCDEFWNRSETSNVIEITTL